MSNVSRITLMFHKYNYVLYICIMRKRLKDKRKTTCSKCNNLLEDNRINKYRYCLSCHNEYMRNNRNKHSELSNEQRLKANCRSYLNTYLKRGVINKQPCIICNNMNTEAHHEDYTKPLDVKWMCRECHLSHHMKQYNMKN